MFSSADLDLCSLESCFCDGHTHGNHRLTNILHFLAPPAVRFPALTVVSSSTRSFQGLTSGSGTGSAPGHRPRPRYDRRNSRPTCSESCSSDTEDDLVMPIDFCTGQNFTPPPLCVSNNPKRLGVGPGVERLRRPAQGQDEVSTDRSAKLGLVETQPLELTCLLLTLIRDICYDDSLQTDCKNCISLMLLPPLVQILTTFHFESDQDSPDGSPDDSSSDIQTDALKDSPETHTAKRFMVRVIFSIASFIVSVPVGLNGILTSGILTTLLHMASDFIRRNDTPSHKALPLERPNEDQLQQLMLAQELVHSSWMLLQHTVLCIPLNPSVLGRVLQLFHDVILNRGLVLVEMLLLRWERMILDCEDESIASITEHEHIDMFKWQLSGLLITLGKVIQFLKQAKINYVHAIKCNKLKHKRCDYRLYMNHHHDILGLPFLAPRNASSILEDLGSSENKPNSMCVVAVLVDFLLQLYKKSLGKSLQLKILACLEAAGICCCMPPSPIVRVLMQNLPVDSPAVCDFIQSVIVKLTLDHFGGSRQIQNDGICSICKDHIIEDANSRTASLEPFLTLQETSDSAFSGSDSSLHDDRHDRATSVSSRWRFLQQFLSLVLGSQGEDLAIQIMQHILKLVLQGSDMLKCELFFSLFLPILRAARLSHLGENSNMETYHVSGSPDPVQYHLNVDRSDMADLSVPVPVHVLHQCLLGLPLLLEIPMVFRNFMRGKVYMKLAALSHISMLRPGVLKVFERLILLDERKRESLEQNVKYLDDVAVQDAQEETHAGIGSHLDLQAGLEVTEDLMYSSLDSPGDGLRKQMTSSTELPSGEPDPIQSVLTEYMQLIFKSGSHQAHMDTNEDRQQSLLPNEIPALVDIWNSCSNLFSESLVFRCQFLSQDGPSLAFHVLDRSLHSLCGNQLQKTFSGGLHRRVPNCELDGMLSVMQGCLRLCLEAARERTRYKELVRLIQRYSNTCTSTGLSHYQDYINMIKTFSI